MSQPILALTPLDHLEAKRGECHRSGGLRQNSLLSAVSELRQSPPKGVMLVSQPLFMSDTNSGLIDRRTQKYQFLIGDIKAPLMAL